MKTLLLSLILYSYSFPAFSHLGRAEKLYMAIDSQNNSEKIVYELINSGYYFSAIPFAENHMENSDQISSEFEKALEKIIIKTGTASFVLTDVNVLQKHKTSSTSLVAGVIYFKHRRYKSAYNILKYVGKNHKFSTEARMMQGASLYYLERFNEAKTLYKQCLEEAQHFLKLSKAAKLRRYYSVLYESCLVHKARISFKQRSFKESIQEYFKIPKNSYLWPTLLLERAWSYHFLEDYNRSLGLLVTYKSPLLSSYFFPEGEVLNALNYLNLCLWDDALTVVDQYYKVYKPRSDQLKSILIPHKNSHTYFLQLMFTPIDEIEKKNPFIRNLVVQIRKKIKFNIDLVTYKRGQRELKALKKIEKRTAFIKGLTNVVAKALNWRTVHLNHYVKKQMFDFINDIHRYSYEMFNVKLEIMARKKDLIYRNKDLVANRSRGDFDNLKRNSEEHFWKFKGSFWADELGDYSFGLKSNCEKVDKDNDHEKEAT